MSQKQESQGGYGWPVVAAVSVLASFWAPKEEALPSTRELVERSEVKGGDYLEASGRLDPYDCPSEVFDVSAKDDKFKKVGRLMVVLVPGRATKSDAEARRRTRYALHCAMRNKYRSSSQYLHRAQLDWNEASEGGEGLKWVGNKLVLSTLHERVERNRLKGVAMKASDSKGESGEWSVDIFLEQFHDTQGSGSQCQSAVVVWVQEEIFVRSQVLNQLLGQLELLVEADVDPSRPPLDKVLVGPNYSEEVWCVTRELGYSDWRPISPWATSPKVDEFLNVFPRQHPSSWAELLWQRTIGSDQELVDLLNDELESKGINVGEVMLFVEGGSDFSERMADGVDKRKCKFDAKAKSRRIYYERGIDGYVDSQNRGSTSGEVRKRDDDIEVPWGSGFVDYLRRMRQLTDGSPVKAVGIFGQDVHDKIMIMTALRPRMPGALFFTNDIDAIYQHPSLLRVSRNLLVASHYGLSVDYKSDSGDNGLIMPFRDAYQVAAYYAFRSAVGDDMEAGPGTLPNPMLYEVGSRDMIELVSRAPRPSGLPPERHDEWRGMVMAILGLLCAFGVLHLLLDRNRYIRASEDGCDYGRLRKGLGRLWAVLCGAAICSAAALCVGVLLSVEPAYWLQGVSVWPSHVIRFAALCLSLACIYDVVASLALLVNSGSVGERRKRWVYVPLGAVTLGYVAWKLGDALLFVARILERPLGSLSKSLRSRFKDLRAGGRLIAVWGTPLARDRKYGVRDGVEGKVRRGFRWSLWMALVLLILGFAVWLPWGTGVPARDRVAEFSGHATTALMLLAFLLLVVLVADLAFAWIGKLESLRSDVEQVFEYCKNGGGGDTAPDAGSSTPKQQSSSELHTIASVREELLRAVHAGGLGIYGPFVVTLLMAASRWAFFDSWEWTPLLVVAWGVVVVGLLIPHIWLSRTASGVKRDLMEAASRLMEKENSDAMLRRLDLIRKEVGGVNEGIFAGPWSHPFLRALTVPFLGAGGFSLLQYLS